MKIQFGLGIALVCIAAAQTARAQTCPSSQANQHTAVRLVAAQQTKDIVDTAASAGSFSTLVAAVKAAELVDVLKGEGPFTVFAPNDEAFAKLPKGTVDDLLKPENKSKLVSILTYHVVPGKVLSGEVAGLKSAKTVNGQTLSVTSKDHNVMIGTAKVVKADIETTNGVIHVIDSVLMPE